jgi:acetyl esterase/lipase
MRIITFLLFMSVMSLTALGQEFWSHRIGIQTDVPYGDDPAQVVDIYTQGHRPAIDPGFELQPVSEPRPTLIWIHGGGWIRGDKATSFDRAVHYLERGWHVVNVNYRIGSGTAPQAVDDVMCAYKWVVDEAQRSGRSDRFVVSGNSAGGHLALVVGLLNGTGNHPCRADIAPSAVVNWYGITDIESVEAFLAKSRPNGNYAFSWIGNRSQIAEISARYSPLSLISDNVPPIITIHGTADNVVPYEQAINLHDALDTRNRLVTLEGGTHGGFSDAQYQEAMTAIFEFLEN